MATFLDDVNAQVRGAPLQRCFHCRKCTAGCPMAVAMDYKPNAVVRMVQEGQREAVLGSSTIWLCVSCETCTMRCPNEVDIARMMDVLRQMALESGVRVAEKKVVAFHEAFLESIRKGGRIHETLMVCAYKLKSGDYFSDVGIGLSFEGGAAGSRTPVWRRTRSPGSTAPASFMPRHITPRITTQGGLFTVHPDPYKPFESDDMTKIIIPNRMQTDLRRTLSGYGINRFSLFPGLDGLAAYIEWLQSKRK